MKCCEICGALFQPKHNAQRFCEKQHFARCPVCNRLTPWNSTQLTKPCSKQCASVQRMRTLQDKYNVTNAVKLRTQHAVEFYDNLKYMQSCDTNYINTMKQHGIDVCKETNKVHESKQQQRLDIKDATIYIQTERGTTQFLNYYGVNQHWKAQPRGVTLNLVIKGAIYQSIRIELAKIKNYAYQISNLGLRHGYTVEGGFELLFKRALEFYELDSVIGILDSCPEAEDAMKEMNFKYEFMRPRLIYWDGVTQYKRTDNIKEMLDSGHTIQLGAVRQVYTWKSG